MTRNTEHAEIVRLSVGNWIVILLTLAAAVGAVLRSQTEFSGEIRERLVRVETRIEHVWQELRPPQPPLRFAERLP